MKLLDVDRRTKFLVLVAVLIMWMASLPTIPFFLEKWGLDLHNVHAYEACADGRSPYLLDPEACGEILHQPYRYPPMLFAFFRWMRPLSLPTAMCIWTLFLLASFPLIFWAWAKKIARERPHAEPHELVFFCALLLLQYPFVFALERGNTDTVTILLYTLGAYLFVQRRVWLAGMAVGLAAGFRIYPIIPIVIVTVALAWASRTINIRNAVRFGGGAFTAFVLSLLVFFRDAKIYLFNVLPSYAKLGSYAAPYSHSLTSYVGDAFPNFAKLLSICLIFAWMWGAKRALTRGDAPMALAGALAASTYTQATSFDYNLITAYPLLLLLFIRAQRTNRWGLLAFGLFAIVGDRRLFDMPNARLLTPHLHLAIQLAFLIVAALVVARPDEEQPVTQQPTDPDPA